MGAPFGHSIGSAADDDGDDGATKGGPGPEEPMDTSGDDDSLPGSSEDSGDSSSDDGDPPEPAESSSDDGDPPEPAESTGPADVEDTGPVGEPMYAPCDPNGESDECADGVCLIIEDQDGDLLSTFCTGPCAFPQQDCDVPDSGTATPACIIANEGESVCTLDCSDGMTCPFGMACMEFAGGLLRCI